MLALVVILLLLLGWALIAGRLARYSVTAPLALLVAGVALTAGQDPVFVFDIEFEAAERIVEVIAAILLFTDATEVPGGVLGREPRLTLRLLLVALPLSLVAAWLVGAVLFPGVNLWLLAVLATIVMSVDLAPAVTFVRDLRIPERLRQVLNAESGLNDGIVAPTFLFCLAAATAAGSEAQAAAAIDAVPSLVVAFLVGAFVGAVAARVLNRALRAGWTQPSALRLGVLTLPLLAYAGAVVLGGNGFIAAFVAGVFFEPEARRLPADALHLVEDVGAVLSLALWFLFGAVLNDVVEARLDHLAGRALRRAGADRRPHAAGVGVADRDRPRPARPAPPRVGTTARDRLGGVRPPGLHRAHRAGRRVRPRRHGGDGGREHRRPRIVDRARRPSLREAGPRRRNVSPLTGRSPAAVAS